MNTPKSSTSFSSHTSFSDEVVTYPLRVSRRLIWLVASLLMLGVAAGIQIYSLIQANKGWRHHGAAVVGEAMFWPLMITAGLILMGFAFATIAYVNWSKSILLHRDGFIYKGRLGLRLWRWQDIATLRMSVVHRDLVGIPLCAAHAYTVEDRTRKRIVLTNRFTRVEELAHAIEKNIFPYLIEPASQQFNLGRDVDFGPLTVNKAGIQIGRKSYAWGDIQAVLLRKGYIHITRKMGGLFGGTKVAMAKIPNVRVLLSLISQVVRIEVG